MTTPLSENAEHVRQLCARFDIGTPAANYLQIIGDSGYLVYPWCDSVAKEKHQIPEKHALVIAALAAKMHRFDIHISDAGAYEFETLPDETIIDVIHRASA